MSIKIMSAIWDGGPSGSTKRFVLIAIADNANDEGECWPSVAAIARKTGLCERAVRAAIRDLEAEGWLQTDISAGRKGTNKYRVTPAPHAPGTTCPPAPHAPTPGTTCPPTPAPHAPEPSFNHQEPSENPFVFPQEEKPRAKQKRACQMPDGWVPSDRNVSDAEAKGFSAMEIESEADRFRDYHAAKGSTFKDWDAAWRTWLGNARKFGARGGMAGQAGTGRYGQGSSIASIAARRWASGQD